MTLWGMLLRACHGEDVGLRMMHGGHGYQGVWKGILNSIKKLHDGIIDHSYLVKEMGNGALTSFWWDVWCGNQQLRYRFPNIFYIALNKAGLVSEFRSVHGWMCRWKRAPRIGVETDQIAEMMAMLANINLSDSLEKWIWTAEPSGDFSVRSLRVLIDHAMLSASSVGTTWCRYVPIKVNVLVWRLELNRLPTRKNLDRRGVALESQQCPICNNHPEEADHIFFTCEFAIQIWRRIALWTETTFPDCGSISDMWQWIPSISVSLEKKKVLTSVYMTTIWALWWFRNDVVFDNKKLKKAMLVDLIMLYSFNWFSFRNSKASRNWGAWLQNPMANYL